ncbi:hypothetical protein E2C01_020600 [Portunus trituberculatus]|uniref:Uncharacterized protein n=1 Tax=Portunus trituberculatus TaxID=210409 RepID=A0A5B7E1Z2_PORTR|nr:hypothetical protein [Portunus trituberculatus]
MVLKGLISSVPGHTAISILHTIWQFIQLQKLTHAPFTGNVHITLS